MRGDPVKVQKEAAKKFCQQILNAQGNNYAALISLNTNASILNEFTSDFEELSSQIDTLYADGGTNIHGSLELAGELLENITVNGAVKNIVLCSDGLPENGERQDGPYVYSDYSNYRYANAAYNIAQTLKQNGYNIYTLGFFHSLYGRYLEFGRRFMKDLASDGSYYEVTDVDKLEFTFGEIADDVLSGDHTPVIIIPGVMGSRFFINDSAYNEENQAWDPIVKDASGGTDYLKTLSEKIIGPQVYAALYELLKGHPYRSLALILASLAFPEFGILNRRMDLSNTVYLRPYEVQNNKYESEQEYGALEAYKNLVQRLCEEYSSENNYRPVYFFSYDWRQSNKDSAKKLNECINTILKDTGAKKVNLVCHSMGGIVASRYFQEHSADQKVDVIVTCGTPYEGSPKLLHCVLTRHLLGDTLQDWALLLGGMSKKLKTSFLGVGELVPSENYIKRLPMYRNKLFTDENEELSFQDYQDICRNEFADYDACYEFQKSLKAGYYNALLKYDKSYFIVGIGQPTITAIKFRSVNNNINKELYEDDLKYTINGDGTVPYYSASISEQLNNLEKGVRVLTFSTNHGGVVSEDECIDWIISKLNNQTSDIPGSNMRNDGYIVVRIACPVDVSISNPSGEELNSSLENFKSSSSFGRLDVIGLSDDIKMLCVNHSPNFSITLNGTDTGTMDYDIRYFNGNDEIYKEDSFRNIPITPNTFIKTGTDDSKTTVLEIDNDGDGEVDDYLVPNSSLGRINITKQPANQSVNAGEYANFTVEASGNGLSYQWNINRNDGRGWTIITGATSSAYSSGPVSLFDDGNKYHCLITDDENHTVSTNSVSLSVSQGGNNIIDDNNNGENNIGESNGGGGCEVSGSFALMLFAGMIILKRKIAR